MCTTSGISTACICGMFGVEIGFIASFNCFNTPVVDERTARFHEGLLATFARSHAMITWDGILSVYGVILPSKGRPRCAIPCPFGGPKSC